MLPKKLTAGTPLKNHGAGRCVSFSNSAFFSVPATELPPGCGFVCGRTTVESRLALVQTDRPHNELGKGTAAR